MAEVGHVDAPSDTSPQITSNTEAPIIRTLQRNNSTRLNHHQPPSGTYNSQQVLEESLPKKPTQEHPDDEVEFVFSVPRRRKKKRRRLEVSLQNTHINSARPSSNEEVAVTHPLKDKSTTDMLPLISPGPEPSSTDMTKSPFVHALHPPTIFESSLQPPDVLHSDLIHPSSSHVSQTMPFKIPPPWYSRAMPPPPSPSSPYYYPKYTNISFPEQDNSKKRKHEEDVNDNSNYVSPYKASSTSMYQPQPRITASHSNFDSTGGHMGFADFLEDPNVPAFLRGVPAPLPPHRPIIPGWQEDFSWKALDPLPSIRPPSVDPRTKAPPDLNNNLEWHRKYYYGTNGSHCSNGQQDPTRSSQNDKFAHELISPKSRPVGIQTPPAVLTSSVLNDTTSQPSPISTKLPTPVMVNHPIQSSPITSSRPTTYTQARPPILAIRASSSPPPRTQVTPADLRRKPSLYKIPAWPPSSDNNQTSSSIMFHEHPSQTRNHENHNPRSPLPSLSQNLQTAPSQVQSIPSSSLQSSISPPPKQQQQQPPIPKHSPNLILDIAQTSADTFPFAAVAARHNKPMQKVVDIFSAIIQLPLLKEAAADGKRHSALGSERLRLYREAKRKMEKDRREKEGGGPKRG